MGVGTYAFHVVFEMQPKNFGIKENVELIE
jgi:hypothetical protein